MSNDRERVDDYCATALGFPKYRADVRLVEEAAAWVGDVRKDGELTLRLDFRADPEAPVPTWEREGWATGGPTFNLIPPSEGPEVRTIRSDVSDPGESRSETGLVRIRLGRGEPWAGLVPAEAEAPGNLSEWRGGSSLAPE